MEEKYVISRLTYDDSMQPPST